MGDITDSMRRRAAEAVEAEATERKERNGSPRTNTITLDIVFDKELLLSTMDAGAIVFASQIEEILLHKKQPGGGAWGWLNASVVAVHPTES